MTSVCQRKDDGRCPLKWTPTSPKLFELAEEKMFSALRNEHELKFVEISNAYVIRSVKIGNFDDTKQLPLVLIHGFAAGSAFWVLNIDALSANRNVYCIDLLGFGRSSRPAFPDDSVQVDELFVNSIEDWRRQMRLEQFVLCGHSFGGYVSSLYTLKHQHRVLHLILDDPWGFPAVPPPGEGPFSGAPKWKKAVFNILSSMNPLSALRLAGPWGPSLVSKLRPDIVAKYDVIFKEGENVIGEYMFHCNAQHPSSGETAFKNVSENMIYAKNPLVARFKNVEDFPITIITGSESWINRISDFGAIQDELSHIDHLRVILIEDAGHHVHADQVDDFNEAVNEICESVQRSYQRNQNKKFGLETSI